MRIGVYVGDSKPTAGGGHYFEQTLLQAILQRASKGKHEFIIFHWQEGKKETTNIQYVNLGKGPVESIINRIVFLAVRWQRWWKGVSIHEDILGHILLRHARDTKVDIMWYLTPSCPTREIPYITVVWDLQYRIQPFWPEMSADGQWMRQERSYREKLQRATGVITGTQIGKKEIQRLYGVADEAIIIAPHPTPQDALAVRRSHSDGSVRKKLGIKNDFFLYPAQFWAHKNHAGLLKAARLLKQDSQHPISWVFVGSDKGNRQYVQDMISRLGLDNDVKILDFVDRQDLLSLYKEAKALVYGSFCGPENLPPLEAFAIGCPVLASDIPGAREQLQDAALLFNPKDPVDIASKAATLLHDKPFTQMLIARGKKIASERRVEGFFNTIMNFVDAFEPHRKSWPNSVNE